MKQEQEREMLKSSAEETPLSKGESAPERPMVGVLAMQGDFDAHIRAVTEAGGRAMAVRTPEQVRAVDALILPGGESTTIGKLLARYGLDAEILAAHEAGKPIYGTCAGMILMAKRIVAGEMRGGQQTLGLMDIAVARNAFGRQADSFESDIEAPTVAPESPLRGVFIRAPYVAEAGEAVKTLATFADKTVLVQQGNLLASAFHPELTGDVRVHRYFLKMIPTKQ